jgi:hypothetical protein
MQRIEADLVYGEDEEAELHRLDLDLEVGDTDDEEAEDRVPAPASAPGQVIPGLLRPSSVPASLQPRAFGNISMSACNSTAC